MATKKIYLKDHLYRFLSSNQNYISIRNKGTDVVVLCTETKEVIVTSPNEGGIINWQDSRFSGTCILSNSTEDSLSIGKHIDSWAGNMNWEDLGKI